MMFIDDDDDDDDLHGGQDLSLYPFLPSVCSSWREAESHPSYPSLQAQTELQSRILIGLNACSDSSSTVE